MKNLFEAAAVEEVRGRMEQLRPDSERLWGKMNPAQALAHCDAAMSMAVGEICPPRALIGRLLGPIAKEVGDRKRDANAPQFDDREECAGDG